MITKAKEMWALWTSFDFSSLFCSMITNNRSWAFTNQPDETVIYYVYSYDNYSHSLFVDKETEALS